MITAAYRHPDGKKRTHFVLHEGLSHTRRSPLAKSCRGRDDALPRLKPWPGIHMSAHAPRLRHALLERLYWDARFNAKASLDRAMGDGLYAAGEDVDPSDEGVHAGVIDWTPSRAWVRGSFAIVVAWHPVELCPAVPSKREM